MLLPFLFFYLFTSIEPNQEQLGLGSPENYEYLSRSGTYTVEGTNDAHDFQETMKGKYTYSS